jgi:hypothetical protein
VKVHCTNNGEIRIEDLVTSQGVFSRCFLTLHDKEGSDDSRKHQARIKKVMIGEIKSKLIFEGQLRNCSYETTITLGKKSSKIIFETKIKISHGIIGDKVVWWCMHPESALGNNFIINMKEGTLSYDYPFGYSQTDSLMVFPLNWIDYSNDRFGVSVFHKGTHGFWIKRKDPLHMMNLWLWSQLEGQNWKTARLLPKNGEYTYQYAIMPHKKDSLVFSNAFEFSNPPIIVRTSPHSGFLPPQKSFITIDKKNVILSAIIPKPDKTIIRLYEVMGQKVDFNMLLRFPEILEIQKVDKADQHITQTLIKHGNSMSAILNQHEITCYSLAKQKRAFDRQE